MRLPRGMPSDGSTRRLACPVVVGIAPALGSQPSSRHVESHGACIDAHYTLHQRGMRTTRLVDFSNPYRVVPRILDPSVAVHMPGAGVIADVRGNA